MAINILTEPEDPPISGDFTRDQAIQQACETPYLSILDDWESTSAEPEAKQGAFIRHAGNTFQVQSADEAISGTPTTGLNYIIATESSGVITLAWASSLSGYSYNPAYGGVYNSSGLQALKDVCIVNESSYVRGVATGNDHNSIVYANGMKTTARMSVASTDTIDLADYGDDVMIIADTSSAAFTLTLSNALNENARCIIMCYGSNNLTVSYTASGGSHSFIMKDTEEVQLLSNGSSLLVVKGLLRLWSGSTTANLLYTTIFGNSGLTEIGKLFLVDCGPSSLTARGFLWTFKFPLTFQYSRYYATNDCEFEVYSTYIKPDISQYIKEVSILL